MHVIAGDDSEDDSPGEAAGSSRAGSNDGLLGELGFDPHQSCCEGEAPDIVGLVVKYHKVAREGQGCCGDGQPLWEASV